MNKKWVRRVWLAAAAAFLVAQFIAARDTRDTLLSRQGAFVAGAYAISVAISVVTVAYMALLVGLGFKGAREFAHAHETRLFDAAVLQAMMTKPRRFWTTLWIATAAIIGNNVIPLTVVGDAPFSTVLGMYAWVLCDDVLVVIPIRVWLYRLWRRRIPMTLEVME